MRLIVGIDDCGHQFAIDVSSFEKLKKHYMNLLNEMEIDTDMMLYYWNDVTKLQKEVESAKSETELLELTEDINELAIDFDMNYNKCRDNFTYLQQP